ncbi:MAG: hypothetical protein IJW73_00460 [Candidatus Gastranaerophilales bacterium]|nr:hypothetical protein [Candidatus Gastranaerophilales bacterium]
MNISFGSNYFINQGHNFPYQALNQITFMDDVKLSYEFIPFEEAFKTGIFSIATLNSPDDYDSEIERILISNNIDFSKSSIEDALNLENITSRMTLDPYLSDSYKLVSMNTDVLNELFKINGVSYVEPNGTNGLNDRYENFCKYLKTGKKIYAPTVAFNEFHGRLSASISDGRHRFAVLRDMGITKIPVAISDYSINIAKKHGLL